MELQGIGWAVQALKEGKRVRREGWNGKGQFLAIRSPSPDESDIPEGNQYFAANMTLPYVFISTVDNQLVPWLCSQTDLLATDWVEVK